MFFKRSRKKQSQTKSAPRGGGMGPSILTAEVSIEGNLSSAGELQIDGEIIGDVRARSVVIDTNGLVQGEVMADDIIVRGRIIGSIKGMNVHILAGGQIQGDVLNENISIENGAFIDGNIQRVDDPLGSGTQVAEHEVDYSETK